MLHYYRLKSLFGWHDIGAGDQPEPKRTQT